MKIWNEMIDGFIREANKNNVRMIMVGGGAVNFHGYQRHSAHVDFWLDTESENLKNLVKTFQNIGYQNRRLS